LTVTSTRPSNSLYWRFAEVRICRRQSSQVQNPRLFLHANPGRSQELLEFLEAAEHIVNERIEFSQDPVGQVLRLGGAQEPLGIDRSQPLAGTIKRCAW
jgi:hypothetical protein